MIEQPYIVLISADECVDSVGVKTLSSCLIEAGYRTVLIMMGNASTYRDLHWEDLGRICKDSCLVGISCMTHGVKKAITIKGAIEKMLPVPIVIGGIHATLDPESLAQEFSLICHGEGEDALVELARRVSAKMPHHDIPGIWSFFEGSVIRNKNRPLKRALDDYPLPDYDISHHYILDNNRLVPVSVTEGHMALNEFVVLGSRGCPHCCTFCSTQKIKDDFPWRVPVRHYSVGRLMGHVRYVNSRYPSIGSFWIVDDTFLAKKTDEVAEFAALYKKDVHKPFSIFLSPWTYDEDKFKMLAEAGMHKIIMGIQSGSEYVNTVVFERRFSSDRILDISRSINRVRQVKPCYDFIGMNPFEGRDDVVASIQLIEKIPSPAHVFVNNLAYYPGTELYCRALREGFEMRTRVKHSGTALGYAILWKERLSHKLFRLILLLMEGDTNSFRIGYVPRFLISNTAIRIFRKLGEACGNVIDGIISLLSFLVIYQPLRRLCRGKIVYKYIMQMRLIYFKIGHQRNG